MRSTGAMPKHRGDEATPREATKASHVSAKIDEVKDSMPQEKKQILQVFDTFQCWISSGKQIIVDPSANKENDHGDCYHLSNHPITTAICHRTVLFQDLVRATRWMRAMMFRDASHRIAPILMNHDIIFYLLEMLDTTYVQASFRNISIHNTKAIVQECYSQLVFEVTVILTRITLSSSFRNDKERHHYYYPIIQHMQVSQSLISLLTCYHLKPYARKQAIWCLIQTTNTMASMNVNSNIIGGAAFHRNDKLFCATMITTRCVIRPLFHTIRSMMQQCKHHTYSESVVMSLLKHQVPSTHRTNKLAIIHDMIDDIMWCITYLLKNSIHIHDVLSEKTCKNRVAYDHCYDRNNHKNVMIDLCIKDVRQMYHCYMCCKDGKISPSLRVEYPFLLVSSIRFIQNLISLSSNEQTSMAMLRARTVQHIPELISMNLEVPSKGILAMMPSSTIGIVENKITAIHNVDSGPLHRKFIHSPALHMGARIVIWSKQDARVVPSPIFQIIITTGNIKKQDITLEWDVIHLLYQYLLSSKKYGHGPRLLSIVVKVVANALCREIWHRTSYNLITTEHVGDLSHHPSDNGVMTTVQWQSHRR